jgi:hypothetical protein
MNGGLAAPRVSHRESRQERRGALRGDVHVPRNEREAGHGGAERVR